MGNLPIFLAVPISDSASILTVALVTTDSQHPQALVSSPHAETRMLSPAPSAKKQPIIPELFPPICTAYYSQNYSGIIRTGLFQSPGERKYTLVIALYHNVWPRATFVVICCLQ